MISSFRENQEIHYVPDVYLKNEGSVISTGPHERAQHLIDGIRLVKRNSFSNTKAGVSGNERKLEKCLG